MTNDPGTITVASIKMNRADREPKPYLVLAICLCEPRLTPARFSLAGVNKVTLGRGSSLAVDRNDGELAIRIPDPKMSSKHARLVREKTGWIVEDPGSKNGTYRNGKKIQRSLLGDGDILDTGDTFFVFRDQVLAEPCDSTDEDVTGLFATLHAGHAEGFDDLRKIARSNHSVMLRGERGVGKEIIAREIHELSGRTGNFVALNCGAIHTGLAESELFGHVKGAFTGATEAKLGAIREADGGTLLLDEVGDLPPGQQTKVLRVLENAEVRPLGASGVQQVNLRVIAATNKNLDELAEKGQFRRDLLDRFEAHFQLPPLRQRIEDVGWLLMRILEKLGGALLPESDAMRGILAHDWPGNIRELQTYVSVATTKADGVPPKVEHFHQNIKAALDDLALRENPLAQRLCALLKEHNGNVAAVGRDIGKHRTQVGRWLKRYGIDPKDFGGGQ